MLIILFQHSLPIPFTHHHLIALDITSWPHLCITIPALIHNTQGRESWSSIRNIYMSQIPSLNTRQHTPVSHQCTSKYRAFRDNSANSNIWCNLSKPTHSRFYIIHPIQAVQYNIAIHQHLPLTFHLSSQDADITSQYTMPGRNYHSLHHATLSSLGNVNTS